METGLVSTLQSYSTKDGPGIRTTAFLVGCNLRCVWCANPELMLPGPKYMYYKQRCIKCGACVAAAKKAEGPNYNQENPTVSLSTDGCLLKRDKIFLGGQGDGYLGLKKRHGDESLGTKKHQGDGSLGTKDIFLNDKHEEGSFVTWEILADVCPQTAYERKGMIMTSEELAAKLLRDKDFFDVSGGGVTFSGGEAALQADFVKETASIVRKKGVQVALDTAGLIPWSKLQPLLEEVDLVLYDIKAFDAGIHKKCTGVENSQIIQNAKNIASINKPLWIRMVLVPGWNDDLEDIRKRFKLIHSLGEAVKRVDVLKYHNLGVSKWQQQDLEYEIAEGTACSDEFIAHVSTIAMEEKVEIHIEN